MVRRRRSGQPDPPGWVADGETVGHHARKSAFGLGGIGPPGAQRGLLDRIRRRAQRGEELASGLPVGAGVRLAVAAAAA